jgi:hypothetical protein
MRLRNFAFVFALAASLICSSAWAQGGKTEDRWERFQFLVGAWSGTGAGKPGESMGKTSFSFDLDKNVIIRKNRVEIAPKAGETRGSVHEDLMIIYRRPGEPAPHAMYFDNEGHTIEYIASFPEKEPSVVFESKGAEKMPSFRLVYEMTPAGELSIEFLIAPPGGEFRSYTKGTAAREKG